MDGLRFIAIVSVVSLHCYAEMLDRMGISFASLDAAHPLLRFIGHGGYGVEVFFAISGFILALPFARQYLRAGREVRLSTYFLRRLTRLEPPYIVWLFIRTVLLLAAGALPLHFLLAHLLASLLYVHNIAFAIASRIEAVSWTLEIEVQFYCLAPILTLIYRIAHPWPRRLLLSTCIAIATPLQWAFLPGWHGAQNAGVFNLSLLAAIQFFLGGLLVADFYVDGWARIPTTWRWDVVSLVFWPLLFWLQPHAFRFLGPLVLPVLFIAAFKGRVVPQVLRNAVISTIGGMCYSIYLTHRTTIMVVQLLLAHFHLHFAAWLASSLLLGIPVSVAAGALYFVCIERPCMDPKWPQKLLARFRSDPEPPIDAAPLKPYKA